MRAFVQLIFLPLALMTLNTALGGSVSGSSAQSGGGSGSGSIDCDTRRRFIGCNENIRAKILNSCFVVIHEHPLADCTWQSCGRVSIVGKKPVFRKLNDNENSGMLIEYGIPFPAVKSDSWECGADNSCLPKAPYPRHYLTLKQALDLRNAPDGTDQAKVLTLVPDSVLQANPYVSCALFNPSQRVRVFAGDKSGASVIETNSGGKTNSGSLPRVQKYNVMKTGRTVLVDPEHVMSACMKLLDVAESNESNKLLTDCKVNATSGGVGGVGVREFKTLWQKQKKDRSSSVPQKN